MAGEPITRRQIVAHLKYGINPEIGAIITMENLIRVVRDLGQFVLDNTPESSVPVGTQDLPAMNPYYPNTTPYQAWNEGYQQGRKDGSLYGV